MASTKQHSMLFVCLGNICRSPIAEAVFNALVEQRGVAGEWTVDSAGTGDWHIGCPPDKRGLAVMRKRGVSTTHRGRQVCRDDFSRFEYILAMDESNLRDLQDLEPKGSKVVLKLLGEFDPKGKREVDDPYYGGDSGFDKVFDHIERSLKAFLDQV